MRVSNFTSSTFVNRHIFWYLIVCPLSNMASEATENSGGVHRLSSVNVFTIMHGEEKWEPMQVTLNEQAPCRVISYVLFRAMGLDKTSDTAEDEHQCQHQQFKERVVLTMSGGSTLPSHAYTFCVVDHVDTFLVMTGREECFTDEFQPEVLAALAMKPQTVGKVFIHLIVHCGIDSGAAEREQRRRAEEDAKAKEQKERDKVFGPPQQPSTANNRAPSPRPLLHTAAGPPAN
jgi:hypothetical protein